MFYEIALIFRSVDKNYGHDLEDHDDNSSRNEREKRLRLRGESNCRIVDDRIFGKLSFPRKEKDLARSFDSRRLTPRKVLTSIRNTVDNFNKQRTLRRSDAKTKLLAGQLCHPPKLRTSYGTVRKSRGTGYR